AAFLWTPETGMVSLQSYLTAHGVNLSGWQLQEARGLSSDGRTIVGIALHNGVYEAWAATLPGHCGSSDFNCDGDAGTDADIDAFFACVAGACPAPPCNSTADFDGDSDVGTDADIEAFFRVLAGGTC